MKNTDKPDFIIIGSMKSGTTSLYDDLAKMQSLFLPTEKEPAILSKYNHMDEIKTAYARHFKNNPGLKCGEASTVYTALDTNDDIVKKAKDLCGNELRLIMIMRDPIERIYSHLRHDISCGRIKVTDVDNVVMTDEKYILTSDYAKKIQPWIEAFGVSNVLCISFIDYCNNRIEVVKRVSKFLDIEFDEHVIDINLVSNKSSELRRTYKYVGYVIRSKVYRYYLRPFLPIHFIKLMRKILLPKRVAPKFVLSQEIEKKLKKRLSSVEKDLEKLTGNKLNIFTNEY